ncbi:hypothetical protein ABZ892_04170 [Streptomyces sp. NPDC046924]|uniref:hypothetical protein n=1 Tax=Streptomyces sp. NPDC046924 TaxID=3155136 RepID=UPI0034091999
MSAIESSRRTAGTTTGTRPQSFTGVSMRDLLAAGAAAAAVSTPPRAPEPLPQSRPAEPTGTHRDAA